MLFGSAAIGGARVSLDAIGSSFGSVQISGSATAIIQLDADGDITGQTDLLGVHDVGDWVSPKAAAGGNFECRLTLNSGTVDIGTTGSWLALSSDRAWTQSQSGDGSSTANVTLEVRATASGVVLDSQTFTFFANVGA